MQATDSTGISKIETGAERALLPRGGRDRHNNRPWGDAVRDVYRKTLERAAQIAGGEQALALQLKITPSHLALWLRGLEEPTTEAFLRAVDLVSEHELAQLPRSRPQPEID